MLPASSSQCLQLFLIGNFGANKHIVIGSVCVSNVLTLHGSISSWLMHFHDALSGRGRGKGEEGGREGRRDTEGEEVEGGGKEERREREGCECMTRSGSSDFKSRTLIFTN